MRSPVRRGGLIALDQAVSSATNFALSLVVARQSSVQDFGSFSLAFIVYLLAVDFMRAVSLEPLMIRHSGTEEADWRWATSAALALNLLGASVIALVLIAVSRAVDPSMGTAIIVLALMLPGLLLQDACRYAFFAAGRPVSAVINDSVWGGATIAVSVVLIVRGASTPLPFVAAWAVSGAVAGLVGITQLGVLPRFNEIPGWIGANRDLSGRYAAEFAMDGGAFYGSLLVASAFVGVEALGALNAARVLMGPVGVLLLSAATFLVSEGSRMRDSNGPLSIVRPIRVSGAVLALTAALWTTLLLLLPDRFGTELVGDSWSVTSGILAGIGIYFVGRSLTAATRSGLRVYAAAHRSIRAQAASAAILLGCVVIGSLIGLVSASAWGFAVGGVAGALVWWTQFEAQVRTECRWISTGGP